MKVGIITFHRAWNYGAVLQCYALQQAIKNLGHDVKVIDYRQSAIEKCYQTFSFKGSIKALLKPEKCYEQGFLYRNRINKDFKAFRRDFLQLTSPCKKSSIPLDFNAYVIGSDQLWVPNWTGNEFDDVYLGKFKRDAHAKVVGYAISTNANSISKMSNKQLSLIKDNFDSLSLREKDAATIIENKLGSKVHIDLDPTLLLAKDSWTPILSKSKKNDRPYMVTYHLPGRYKALGRSDFVKSAEIIAEKHHLELVDLSSFKYSVSDFVSLISNASLVLTSSFHATVFSLIFNRPLIALQLNDGFDNRYVELLHAVGADNAIYGPNFTEVNHIQTDYSKVNNRLQELRVPSLDYLKENLQ